MSPRLETIESLEAKPKTVFMGKDSTLACIAKDPDGGKPTQTWQVNDGAMTGAGSPQIRKMGTLVGNIVSAQPEDDGAIACRPGSDNSTFIPCLSKKLVGEIDQYKPANWPELIKKAKKELGY